MVHQIMLLQIELKSGYIATHIAENGFSPAWSNGLCILFQIFLHEMCNVHETNFAKFDIALLKFQNLL